MAGKEGVLFFAGDDDVVGHIEAPPRLAGVPDAYAVYVIGDSMSPRYEPGEVVCVNPYLPPRRDDYVVVKISEDNGVTVAGFIKRFIEMNERELRCSQLKPIKTLKWPRKNVIAVHRIVWAGPSS